MRYKYEGFDRRAQRVSGEVEGANTEEATSRLRTQNIRALRLVPERQNSSESGSWGDLIGLSSSKPTIYEFTAFIRQFATLQSAGIPIVQSLSVLAEQAENRGFGRALAAVQKMIEEGQSFTEALKRYPNIFDRIFVNLIAAGEISGSLDQILLRLATYYEKSASLKRKVQAALTYPAVVIGLVIAVVSILLVVVVPIFAQMFAANNKELPQATKIVLGISDYLQANWLLVLLGVGSAVGLVIYLFKDEAMRKQIDPLLITMPVFGDLFKKIGIARFSRTLGTMIQSGVPILDALEITGRVAGNYAIENAIQKTKQSISAGNTLAAPLATARVFPKMAISMIAIGEQTGALDQMLVKIAEFYEDEVDNKVTSLTSLLEPFMIIVVGIVVAAVLIPMYLPIFKLGEALSGGG